MLSLNFASRARLGEVLPNLPEQSGISDAGAEILKREVATDDDNQQRFSTLEMLLRPDSAVATMVPLAVRITYHGDIDQELRVFERPCLPHGPVRFGVYDASHAHNVQIEITSPTGVVLSKRAAFPVSGAGGMFGEGLLPDGPSWHHAPSLAPNQRRSFDGSEIHRCYRPHPCPR